MGDADSTHGGGGDGDLSAAPLAVADTIEGVLAQAVSAPSVYPTLSSGTLIAERYEIDRVLGAGGMGTVYLARDRTLDRAVALKLHRTPAAADRLHREAIAMAKLAHPNVVTVFEIGELDGRAFVAMEYIQGATLRDWLDKPRSRREILAALRAAGEGLAAAHDAELVHRDVKPDNIFVGADGRVRIGDFGLAQLRPAPTSPVQAHTALGTETGMIVGTPAYMAPEQIAGAKVDARTDQFAFCVAAWEALCGVRPFEGTTTGELERAIVRGQPARPARRVPARIRRVLLRGLAAVPEARWPSLRILLARLVAAERRPRLYAIGGGLALAAAAAGAWALWPARDPAAACATAGAEVDDVLTPAIVDQATAAARRGGRANGEHEATRIASDAASYREEYRTVARAACEARARADWSPELASRSAECLAYEIRTARELFVAAPRAATQPSDVLQVALSLPPLAMCVDPTLLATWRPLASTPAELEDVVTARARLDAAMILLELDHVAAARALRAQVLAGPHANPAVARRLELLRGSLAVASGDVKTAEPVLAELYYQSRAAGDGALSLVTAKQLIDLTGAVTRDYDAAERWIREGVAEAERQQQTAPRDAFDVEVSAAATLVGAGDVETALKLVARATALGQMNENRRLSLLGVRASAYAALGKTTEALAATDELLRELRTTLGADHPKVAQALADRAQILLAANRASEAASSARAAMAILDHAGDDASTSIARAELNLGATLIAIDDPGAAAHLERARRIYVATFGEDHPDVALVDTNLALVYLDRKDVARATAMLRHATAVQERVLGPEHDELSDGLYNLAVAERQGGELEAALATSLRCAAIRAKHQPGSVRHATALAHVATVQNLRAQHDAALATATATLATTGANEDPMTGAWARLEAGRALIALHREPSRARALLTQARAYYSGVELAARLTEIDAMLAALR